MIFPNCAKFQNEWKNRMLWTNEISRDFRLRLILDGSSVLHSPPVYRFCLSFFILDVANEDIHIIDRIIRNKFDFKYTQKVLLWHNYETLLSDSFSLTHWGRVTHISVSKLTISKLTIIGSDNGVSPDRCQSHYLKQCWNIVNWTLRNKFQWNFNHNSNIFIQENALENGVCEMASNLYRPLCVNTITLARSQPELLL